MLLRENTINEERFSPVSRVPLKEMDEHSRENSLTDPMNRGEQGLRVAEQYTSDREISCSEES
jgi:hypothetical protein